MNQKYYIYNNEEECFMPISFCEFELAEDYLDYLIETRKKNNLAYDFDIYKKIT